jgi:selenocysteine-specific elongation factor
MSDIIRGAPAPAPGIVIGTAGHIDHGKTTLVRALTGIDTDRLIEEKKRGISIDLGFAHLVLPNSQRIAIVDVPGHERFIKNMLAGAGGIDAVMLVIAADEGVKPQTREHFEICRLLGVSHGVVVLTKADVVNGERLRESSLQASEFCRGTFLEGAPVVPVSAHSGAGLAALRLELGRLVEGLKPRPQEGFARMPIDRCFKMQGFGTVVTGTLWSGALKVGDTVDVHPIGEKVRIRGLQVHNQPVTLARAGQRTAVNLAGIETNRISRGCCLAAEGVFDPVQTFDTVIEWISPDLSTRPRQRLHLHLGCVETMADVRLIDCLNEAATSARISVREPVLALPTDRFVLRSAYATVAGGKVIDVFPPMRLNRVKTGQRLAKLFSGDDRIRLELLVDEGMPGRTLRDLERMTGWTQEAIRRLAGANERLLIFEPEQSVLSLNWLRQKRGQVMNWLATYHAAHPESAGAPVHEVRSASMRGVPQAVSELIVSGIDGVIVHDNRVSLATHSIRVSPEEIQIREKLEFIYREAGFQPPTVKEVFAAVNGKSAAAQLDALLKAKRLVRVSPELLFHADVLLHVRESLAKHKGRQFSVPEFKDWTKMSRKFAIPLLELLDREHITRRNGDQRVVL